MKVVGELAGTRTPDSFSRPWPDTAVIYEEISAAYLCDGRKMEWSGKVE